MKNKLIINFILLLISVAALAACEKSGETVADNSMISPANTSNSAPSPSPTPRSFSAAQLLTYLKANEAELGEMLTDKEIIVTGEVWLGGHQLTDSFSFEYSTPEGIISAHGFNGDKAKHAQLAQLVDDYNAKRTGKMPLVTAKCIYRRGFSPSKPPNNKWVIVMDFCTVLEVIQ